jgi:hypothetical protein
MTSPEDLAYTAGFLDGEGCFTVINRKNAASIRVTASNTYKPVLEWLKSKFGGCVAPQYKDPKKLPKNHRPNYVWNVDSANAKSLIIQIIPYLRQKREQAELLLELHKTKQPRGRRKLPQDVSLKREEMFIRLKEMKRVSY